MIEVFKRVLGIDCGTAIVGWAVMEKKSNKLIQLAYGAILTSAADDMSLRLRNIYFELQKIIEKYRPNEMAIEDIFYFKNSKTVISVSQARGVIMLAGAMKNLPIFNYTPLQVKTAVTGYGRAEKKQIQLMVTRILNLSQLPKPDDVADALAISICHLNYNHSFKDKFR